MLGAAELVVGGMEKPTEDDLDYTCEAWLKDASEAGSSYICPVFLAACRGELSQEDYSAHLARKQARKSP